MSLKKLEQQDPELYQLIQKALSAPVAYEARNAKLAAFLRESGMKVFSYGDVKQWIEQRFGEIEASEWHAIERELRELAEKCVLGRQFYIDGEWKDYGCGQIAKPPSKRVRFYIR